MTDIKVNKELIQKITGENPNERNIKLLFAKMINCSRRTVYLWLSGDTVPSRRFHNNIIALLKNQEERHKVKLLALRTLADSKQNYFSKKLCEVEANNG